MNSYRSFVWLVVIVVFIQHRGWTQQVEDIDWLHLIQGDLLTLRDSGSSLASDTTAQIKDLISKAGFYTNTVNFNEAYDAYWKALKLAIGIDSQEHMAQCYNGLGILYSIFSQNDQAESNFHKAIAIKKMLDIALFEKRAQLITSYFDLAVYYRYLDPPNIRLADTYLDSCEQLQKYFTQTPRLVYTERAYLQILKGNLQSAESQLLSFREHFEKNQPQYLVIYYSELGKLYLLKGEYQVAQECLESAILEARKHLSHLNFLPYIYQNLSEVYFHRKQFAASLNALKTANDLNEWLYSSKSPKNESLIEIKDQFRVDQEARLKQINEQKIAQLEQDKEIWLLRGVLTLLSIVFVIIMIIIWVRKTRRRHRDEQKALEAKNRIEREKNAEMIEIKNKELTNSTLQIIAKDELIDQLNAEMKMAIDQKDLALLKKSIKSIKLNKDISWLEFENRFTSVNSGFIDQLKTLHPNLTSYDLKVCSLIKLNFSGKEMARLLSISPESANTARYRLRKKLNLSKDQNLFDYIESV